MYSVAEGAYHSAQDGEVLVARGVDDDIALGVWWKRPRQHGLLYIDHENIDPEEIAEFLRQGEDGLALLVHCLGPRTERYYRRAREHIARVAPILAEDVAIVTANGQQIFKKDLTMEATGARVSYEGRRGPVGYQSYSI